MPLRIMPAKLRVSRRRVSAVLGVFLGVLVLVPIGTAASADSANRLPIARFRDMVVDDAHARVFVSGDDSVVVAGFDGSVETTVANLAGAAGMALDATNHILYVALSSGDVIARIDTETLTRSSDLPIGDATEPGTLVLAGGRLWFGFGCDAIAGGLASVHTDGTEPTVYTGPDFPGVCPRLAASPGAPDVIVAGDAVPNLIGSSWPRLTTYDVSAASPAMASRHLVKTGGWDVIDLTMSADGATVFATFPDRDSFLQFATQDLADVEFAYGPSAAPIAAVAPTADSAFVAAGNSSSVWVHPTAGQSPDDVVRTGYADVPDGAVWARGLEFSQDGTRLFAADGYPNVVLSVWERPTALWALIRAGVTPDPARPGQAVSFIGTFGYPCCRAAGGEVLHVSRTGSGQTSTELPDVNVGGPSADNFSFADTPPSLGRYRYTITYDGNAETRASTITVPVAVVKHSTVMSCTARPRTVPPTDPVTVSGRLVVDKNDSPKGRTVRLFRRVNGGTEHLLAKLETDANGGFRYVDHPAALGGVQYRASFDGDAAYTGSSAPAEVGVQQLGTRLILKSSARTTTYGEPVELTAHLNAFADVRNRIVKIYATPYRLPERLVGTGPVNSNGDLVVSVKPALNTTYRAEWAGDLRYVPAKTAEVEVRVRTIVTSRLAGAYGTSGPYSLYHAGANPKVVVHVVPNEAGRKIELFLQEKGVGGHWHSLDLRPCCFRLGATSTVTVTLIFGGDVRGHAFRIRSTFYGPDVAVALSPYQLFRFT